MTCSVTYGTGRTSHIKANHGTYRSGELVSGTVTTALNLGGITTGQAGWMDEQADGQLGTGGKGSGSKEGKTRDKTT